MILQLVEQVVVVPAGPIHRSTPRPEAVRLGRWGTVVVPARCAPAPPKVTSLHVDGLAQLLRQTASRRRRNVAESVPVRGARGSSRGTPTPLPTWPSLPPGDRDRLPRPGASVRQSGQAVGVTGVRGPVNTLMSYAPRPARRVRQSSIAAAVRRSHR
jgi:hypothetical protein